MGRGLTPREVEELSWLHELGITIEDTGEFPTRHVVIRNGEEVFSSRHGTGNCRTWIRGFLAGRISGLESAVEKIEGSS